MKKGQVNTPAEIVSVMMDYASYTVSNNILDKHFMDNSCGNGNILVEAVRRYIASYKNDDPFLIGVEDALSRYIHGIELDEKAIEECRDRLDNEAAAYGIYGVDWDLKCGDALVIGSGINNMDFVICNPPYVRIHDLADSEICKEYEFSSDGMTDLYLAFYELGIKMLSPDGIMCYISPSSWLSSNSGQSMRNWVEKTHRLSSVIDFRHTKVFGNVSTYAMITLIDGLHHSHIRYDIYEPNTGEVVPKYYTRYKDAFVGGYLMFGEKDALGVMSRMSVRNHSDRIVRVKNGYATLADEVFIDEYARSQQKSPYEIEVYKASSGKDGETRCFFPYKKNPEGRYEYVDIEEIKSVSPSVYEYIKDHEEELRKRTYERKGYADTWWLFGRSQAINDTGLVKIAINNTIRGRDDLYMRTVDAGSGVYGGLYIVPGTVSISDIKEIVDSDDFVEYVKMLKKYKSGGYYTFSGKDLEKYINYKLKDKLKSWKEPQSELE